MGNIILTHGDLDGMVSGILLLQAVGVDTPLRITNGVRLAEALAKINADEQVQAVYLADIPLSGAHAEVVQHEFQRLTHAACSLHLYDHHFGWEPYADYFTTFHVETRRTTAAVLVWQHALQRAAHTQRWLALLSEKDQSRDAGMVQDFFTLLALMRPANYRHTKQVLCEMAKGEAISELRRQLADAYIAEQLPCEQALLAQVEITTTQHGRSIAWVDARKVDGPCNIARRVIEQYGVDLVATMIPNAVLLGADGIDRGIDLKPLHGTHRFDGVEIEVVGHHSPVRLQPLRKTDRNFHDTVRDFIAQVL